MASQCRECCDGGESAHFSDEDNGYDFLNELSSAAQSTSPNFAKMFKRKRLKDSGYLSPFLISSDSGSGKVFFDFNKNDAELEFGEGGVESLFIDDDKFDSLMNSSDETAIFCDCSTHLPLKENSLSQSKKYSDGDHLSPQSSPTNTSSLKLREFILDNKKTDLQKDTQSEISLESVHKSSLLIRRQKKLFVKEREDKKDAEVNLSHLYISNEITNSLPNNSSQSTAKISNFLVSANKREEKSDGKRNEDSVGVRLRRIADAFEDELLSSSQTRDSYYQRNFWTLCYSFKRRAYSALRHTESVLKFIALGAFQISLL